METSIKGRNRNIPIGGFIPIVLHKLSNEIGGGLLAPIPVSATTRATPLHLGVNALHITLTTAPPDTSDYGSPVKPGTQGRNAPSHQIP